MVNPFSEVLAQSFLGCMILYGSHHSCGQAIHLYLHRTHPANVKPKAVGQHIHSKVRICVYLVSFWSLGTINRLIRIDIYLFRT